MKRRLEKAYFALLIVFILLFLTSILLLIHDIYFNLNLGLAGIFASFASAFIIAWISEHITNTSEKSRKERIRKYYIKLPKDEIIHLLEYLIITNNLCGNYFKSVLDKDKLLFENIIYNMNFLFQLEFLIRKYKLQEFSREKTIQNSKNNDRYLISSLEFLDVSKKIKENIELVYKSLKQLEANMKAQNSFNDLLIFSEEEIELVNNVVSCIDKDLSESTLLCYSTFDNFFKSLEKMVDFYKIKVDFSNIEKIEESLLKILKDVPKIHDKFYNNHKFVRDKAEDFLNIELLGNVDKGDE